MNNKTFLIFLIIAIIMVFGIIAENARLVTTPEKDAVSTVDTAAVRTKIRNAGLTPREAMHWKEL